MSKGFRFSSTNNPAPDSDIPGGDNIDNDAWRMAEESVRGRNGGFSGVSDEEKFRQIKEAYDQITENTEAGNKWEGREE